MSQKLEITKCIMNELGLQLDPKNIKKFYSIWWKSIRNKKEKGLWLTELGFDAFVRADIKNYKIKFPENITFDNKFIIWLDNKIDCPFFLDKKEIYVFGEKTAVQLMLFSGDIKMWHNIHIKKVDKIS